MEIELFEMIIRALELKFLLPEMLFVGCKMIFNS